ISYVGLLRQSRGNHDITTGFTVIRRQINGSETESQRGYFTFTNNFGRDAVTNLRLGTPTQYAITIGNIHRGFRAWDLHLYTGDNWRISPHLNLLYGLRWQPTTRPTEVNRLSDIPYRSDWNNLGPMVGFAYRIGDHAGTLRGAYGLHF